MQIIFRSIYIYIYILVHPIKHKSNQNALIKSSFTELWLIKAVAGEWENTVASSLSRDLVWTRQESYKKKDFENSDGSLNVMRLHERSDCVIVSLFYTKLNGVTSQFGVPDLRTLNITCQKLQYWAEGTAVLSGRYCSTERKVLQYWAEGTSVQSGRYCSFEPKQQFKYSS
jgi:hypothetical protein